MASRKSTEFFEAFRTAGAEAPPPGRQRPGAAPATAEGVSRPSGADAPARYTFTRNKLAAMIAGAAALIVAAFLTGLAVGSGRSPGRGDGEPLPVGKAPEQPVNPDPGKGSGISSPKTGKPSTPAPASYPVKLRIISGITQESARQIRDFLQERDYTDIGFIADNGRYTVYVGTFRSADSPEAKKFKQTFQRMSYGDGTPFESCYFVTKKD